MRTIPRTHSPRHARYVCESCAHEFPQHALVNSMAAGRPSWVCSSCALVAADAVLVGAR